MSTQNKTCSLTYWLINWLTAPRSSCSRWYHHRHPDLPSERIHCQSEKQTSGEGTVSLFFVHFLDLNVLSIWRNSSGVLWQTTVQSWTPFFFCQEVQMKFMDSRIKLMNEILNGMKILKFYAWEEAFLRRVGVLRDGELDALKRSQILHSVSLASFNSSSFLVSLTPACSGKPHSV